jgi:dihydrofolate reductase
MRKLVAVTFVTLDGVMQAPGGEGEDNSGGFKSEGWSVHYFDDIVGQVMDGEFAKHPDLLLGRKTYELMAAYWPHASAEEGGDNLNNARKFVVSRTLDRLDWQNSTLIKGDVVEEITRLKALDGPEIQVHGSGELLQTLLKNRLVDELHLKIFPVIVGGGKRIFADGAPPVGLKLRDSQVSGTGVIIANYVLDGDLKTGTFALENPPN